MATASRATGSTAPKTRLVLATLDLLRRSGLSGAGINAVVEASGAPKGSVYHYFRGGKHELVTVALREAERTVGDGFDRIFRDSTPIGRKVRALFSKTAAGVEANRFTKGCPVAAVTLDLDEASEALRAVCGEIFDRWAAIIARGLQDVPPRDRRAVAQLIVVTLEGGLVLARAHGNGAPLVRTGATLADMLDARFRGARRRGR